MWKSELKGVKVWKLNMVLMKYYINILFNLGCNSKFILENKKKEKKKERYVINTSICKREGNNWIWK